MNISETREKERESETAFDLSTEIVVTPDGAESEDIGLTKPFDPLLINISTKQITIDLLCRRLREGELILSPDFQRGEVWNEGARSKLIESLLIRIPLPAFYVDATDENEWLVVDGLQRLATLRDFAVSRTMKLRGLEFLTQFNGATYHDLPRSFQRRIEETQVTIFQIEKGTPLDVKFNIFKRINTGGLPLTSQEIRHALNLGQVTELLKKLATSQEFQDATHGGVSDKRMVARECVLRFMAFVITPPETYSADGFDSFLSKAMATINKQSQHERDDLEGRFRRALKAAFSIFGDVAFRKPRLNGRGVCPVNKALFEVCTIALDRCSDEQICHLVAHRERVIDHIDSFMRVDLEFINAISQGTGDVRKVHVRFQRFSEQLEAALL